MNVRELKDRLANAPDHMSVYIRRKSEDEHDPLRYATVGQVFFFGDQVLCMACSNRDSGSIEDAFVIG